MKIKAGVNRLKKLGFDIDQPTSPALAGLPGTIGSASFVFPDGSFRQYLKVSFREDGWGDFEPLSISDSFRGHVRTMRNFESSKEFFRVLEFDFSARW